MTLNFSPKGSSFAPSQETLQFIANNLDEILRIKFEQGKSEERESLASQSPQKSSFIADNLDEILRIKFEQGKSEEREFLFQKYTEVIKAFFDLSEEGLERFQAHLLLELNPPVEVSVEETPDSSKESLTSRFIREKGGKLYPYLERYLSKRIPRSAEQDEIPDHIQGYLLKAIKRDAWAKELSEKGSVDFSKIAYFCLRSSFSDMRAWGKNPGCRALKGALTETERKAMKDLPEVQSYAFSHLRYGSGKVQWEDTDDSSRGLCLQDTASGDLQEETLRSQTEKDFYRVSEEIIRSCVQTANCKIYLNAFWGLASGMTAKEIAQAEGLEENRGTALVSDLKRILRDAKSKGRYNEIMS